MKCSLPRWQNLENLSLTEAMQPFNQFMAQMPKRTESGAILDKFEVQKLIQPMA